MEVKWLAKAIANLSDQIDYIGQDNPHAALRALDSIEGAVARLALHPAMGRPGRVAGTRELVVPGTRFVIPYRVKNQRVEILRVLHTAQRWPRRF